MSKAAVKLARSRSTLHDVAGAAGVSTSTVSAVLAGKSGHRRISEETRTKVFTAASALGYTPNLLHRSMRRGRTNVISFYNAFRNRARGDLYLDRLSEGLEHAGGELGYDILVHCNYSRDTQETYEFLNGGFADGLVLFGAANDEPLLPHLRSSQLPTVLVGPRYDESDLSYVTDDEASGMKLIAQALVDTGHQNIGAISEPGDPTGRVLRLSQELAKFGITYNNANTIFLTGEMDEAVNRFCQLEPRPTALFVWHDRNAYKAVEALESLGLEIPNDISVIGYDGLVWPSTSGHVVATVKVPLEQMAQQAIEFLDRLIGGDTGALASSLPVQFDPGTTLGPPAS